MATRLDKIMEPILKEKCDKAFQKGYKKGFEAGGKNMAMAYENEINSLKYMLGRKRFLLRENGEMIPLGQRWIPVTEDLPKLIPCGADMAYSEAVNILTSGRKVLTAIWDGFDWIYDAEFWDAEGEDITHWTPVLLPLPQPPKGE